MPQVFIESSFKFESRDQIPDHIEAVPDSFAHPARYHLDGVDQLSHTFPLARDISDLPTAEILRDARLRLIEQTKNASTSSKLGTQVLVVLIYPRSIT